MIKQLTSILLFVTVTWANVLPQKNSFLQIALEKYSKINSYQCKCLYSANAPFQLSYGCTTLVTRDSSEPICGFNYYFKYDEEENINDFHIFNGSAYYSSYKGKITKTTKVDNPDAFIDREYESKTLGKVIKPSVVKSPVMFNWTLFSVENEVKRDLDDTTLEFSQIEDTLFDGISCSHFKFSKVGLVKDLYLDNSTLLPKYYKVSSKSSLFDQTQSVMYQDFNISEPIPTSFYAEDNLLPNNWKENLYVPSEVSMIGQKAPEWALPELKSDSILSLSNFIGKVILLEYTATWCAHCIEATAMMHNLVMKLNNNENVILLSIFSSSVDDKEKILKFSEKYNISNKILYNAQTIGDTYHVEGYPKFFIIDDVGIIVNQYRGYSEDLENTIFQKISQLAKQ